MDKELSKTEVEAELADHSENMNRRIESMEKEVTSTLDDVLAWIKQKPLVTLGGAFALGLISGYILSSRRSQENELTHLQEQLVEHYLEAMNERIERGMTEGFSRREAIQKALNDNVPLILYQADGEQSASADSDPSSLFFLLKTSFGWMLREIAQEFLHNLVAGVKSSGKQIE